MTNQRHSTLGRKMFVTDGVIMCIHFLCFLNQFKQYNKMGQNESNDGKKNQNIILQSLKRDPRLIERISFIPELFPNSVDSEIRSVEKIFFKMPHINYFQPIVDGLDERFSQEGVGKKLTRLWYELRDESEYINLLKKLERNKHVQKNLNQIITEDNKSRRLTVRKQINSKFQSCLDKLLFSKLFLHYYILILKKYFSSKEEQERDIIKQFHNKIGKMLCQMIEYNHFQLRILTQLSYRALCIEKYENKQMLKGTLQYLKNKFWPIYLKKEHSISVSEKQFHRIRQISRCYLDEIYLHTLKEAEDPQIIINQGDSLAPIKNFPVSKVKRK